MGYVQDSTADGEGLRDVLFLTGCDHFCEGCHNQESWNPNNGIQFTKVMEDKLITHVKRLNPPSLTLSGGDPLFKGNYKEVLELCKRLKKEDINIWLYTGYTLAEVKLEGMGEILEYINVLVDGRFEKDLYDKALLFRGSSNQVIHKLR